MAQFKIYRETALPGSLQPYAIYLIAPAAKPDYVEMYVTDASGTATRRIPTDADIQAMINAAVASANAIQVVADIAARDALAPTGSWQVFVRDATGDPSVSAGGAMYLWDTVNTVWVKTAETESLDLSLDWADLTGKPASTPANIDDAVTKRHTHANKTELDKIGEDGNGDLTYGGQPVATQWNSTGW